MFKVQVWARSTQANSTLVSGFIRVRPIRLCQFDSGQFDPGYWDFFALGQSSAATCLTVLGQTV